MAVLTKSRWMLLIVNLWLVLLCGPSARNCLMLSLNRATRYRRCCCLLVSTVAKSRYFAVSVGAVHGDSTVSVVGIEGQSKRWWVS